MLLVKILLEFIDIELLLNRFFALTFREKIVAAIIFIYYLIKYIEREHVKKTKKKRVKKKIYMSKYIYKIRKNKKMRKKIKNFI